MVTIIQIVIALGILNVWLLRFGKPSAWRGGDARNMVQEFRVYGLPTWSMWLVGFIKVLCAVLLLVGIWLPSLANVAAIGLVILMLGAVAMHTKVKDPLTKSLPALSLLVLSLIVAAQ